MSKQQHSAEPFEPALSNEQIDALWKANWPNLDAVCRAIERAAVLADREGERRGSAAQSWAEKSHYWHGEAMSLQARIATLERRCGELMEVLKEMRRAIGDHFAPDHCYATGPMTGDPIRDLVQCPACSAIAMYDAAIAAAGEKA